MPNTRNIDAPITLIAPGRSGTTLMSAIFNRNPQVSTCGETGDLIFDLWNSAQRSIGHISPELNSHTLSSLDSRVSRFVRHGILSLLADDKTFWFHKPIGIPFSFTSSLPHPDAWNERADLYWTVMENVFPRGKFLTILRHPCDVVTSFKRRFDADEATTWAVIAFLAEIISHPKSRVGYAVPYDALVSDPEAAVRGILAYVDVPFDARMLYAFGQVHTRSPIRESSCDRGFTWREQWSQLDFSVVDPRFVESIKRLYRRFGFELQLPRELSSNQLGTQAYSPDSFGKKPAHVQRAEMRRYIEQLESRVVNLNTMWEERALRQENEFHQTCLALQQQVSVLRRLDSPCRWVAHVAGRIRRLI